MNFLKNHQLPAKGFGGGWESGRVSDEQMLEIFSNAKINLNFTESYFNWPKQLAKLFFRKELGKYIFTANQVVSNLESLIGARRKQIKGRIFEVAACGGFLITGDADNLRDYYIDGKEIVIFKDKADLAEKCKFYLAHDLERKEIALAGYNRTLKEHTYQHRFQDIFKKMELI
ncbi:MAG TPA: glycosyltransferase [Candidatus Limnocylindria bacterium]|nr:glycosyltransferase [Candidatus Limnocylindria bacterium]